ncbi:phosphatidylserine decarboxylase [Desarmillaria tabescens]|uniref:Phosphatidylserine decarboxylase n=1 Tax=Armillaria tabescens TaxID=1929756 RepID=A0AA39JNS5_ARMTA|nr:phosphatidylserine decarboxylase [Desarmillaria tabescens]KAK0446033.1 phosphatidylserine decarboxylase [Desarmillaria tabescens]
MSRPPKTSLTRYGGWLPVNPAIITSFVQNLIQVSAPKRRARAAHTEPVANFQAAINADPEMVDLWNQIFLQASTENKITDFDQLLYLMDEIIVAPPRFYMARDDAGNIIGEPIGVPMYLLFDLLSNTGAAYDLFRKQAFNAALKDLLDAWGAYLKTPDSNKTLTDDDEGWFGTIALKSLEDKDRGEFNTTYVCPDPDAVNRGFTSWDEFFTREVQADARPVEAPPADVPEDKQVTFIHSACESTVYRIQTDVKDHDQFWLKGQAYSVYDMLYGDEDKAQSFIGGTVYQAFLSPQDYHRWRCPIDGTITRADVVPGTYYAVLPDAGAEVGDPDLQPGDPHGALIRSQAWLTHSSTRAIIYIQADSPDIGLVAFIGVGMAEVSTCEVTVQSGQKVSTGDELGMFHFGGSSHALIFGPQVNLIFDDVVEVDQHIKVNSTIAYVPVSSKA